MLKYVVASVVLTMGLAVSAPPALAAPRNDDCVNCASPKPYDSEEPARIRREIDRAGIPDATTAPAGAGAPVADGAVDAPVQDCSGCPPPKRYDSTEVVKTSHDVDQSRVINTETVVQVPPRTKEINKLIVRENETRNVGVIQHNHRIIEKETRYVKRAPVYRPAVPQYRVVQRVQTVLVPVVVQQPRDCSCGCGCSSQSYGGGYAYGYAPVQYALVPMAAPSAYGYRTVPTAYGYR